MTKFFELLLDINNGNTLILYCLIVFFSSLFGFMSQTNKAGRNNVFKPIPYICSFIILLIFFAFNDVGIDTPHYRDYFDTYRSSSDIYTGIAAVEVWYQYLNIYLHYITDDSTTAIIILRTVQLSIIFYSIYLLRDKISIGFAVLSYVILYYFQSFNLLRSSLAGSLCLLSFVLCYNRKYLMSFVLAFFAFEIHRSAILFDITLVLYFISSVVKKHQKLVQVVAIIGLAFLMVVGKDLLNIFLSNNFGEGRYDDYSNSASGFGIFVFLQYLPVAIALYYQNNIHNRDDLRWWNLGFVFAVSGFAIALMGYTNGMLTRAAIFFSATFIFLLPYFYRTTSQTLNYANKCIINSIYVCYLILVFINKLGGFYAMDGLGPFKFI